MSDGREIGEIFEFGVGGEFSFLDRGYLDVVGVEECGKLVVTVENAVGIELENIESMVGRGRGVWDAGGWRW